MRKLLVLTSCIAVLFTACGEDEKAPEPVPPEMTELQLECVDSDHTGVDSQVLQTVSVMVTDEDRDLLDVEGSINGQQIALTDPDADERFTWSVPESDEPMICDGEFVVNLSAIDAAGNEAVLLESVEK